MWKTVYFDNGAYVPSTLEDEMERVQADVASIRELFGAFEGLYVSAVTGPLSTNDMDDVHEEGEDKDLDGDVDDEGYWSSVISQQRLNPVNPFERPVYYRAMHTGSRLENANGDFLARLPPPQDVQETRMRRWVERHATLENRTMPTPFLSVTTELLRALNSAEHFRMRGYKDIRIKHCSQPSSAEAWP